MVAARSNPGRRAVGIVAVAVAVLLNASLPFGTTATVAGSPVLPRSVSAPTTADGGALHGVTAPQRSALAPGSAPRSTEPSPVDPATGSYWAGADYTGAAENTTSIRATIEVPDDLPQSGNGSVDYNVVLSLFDTSNSLDQIGFGAHNGSWLVVYSTSTNCTTVHGGNRTAVLTAGAWYDFGMTLAGGAVQFEVVPNGTSTPVFSASVVTGAAEFSVQELYACPSGTTYDLTVYENVVATVGPRVPYDFFVAAVVAGSAGPLTSWGQLLVGNPSGVTSEVGSPGTTFGCPTQCLVSILNEPFYLLVASGGTAVTVDRPPSGTTLDWNFTVGEYAADAPVELNLTEVPAGWSATFVTHPTRPPYTVELTVTVPPTAALGTNVIELAANDTHNLTARSSLLLDVTDVFAAVVAADPSTGRLDAGQTTTLTATGIDGSGGYVYEWTSLPEGCGPSSNASVACTILAPGNYTVTVSVTDSLGNLTTGSLSLDVLPDPMPEAPSTARVDVDVGDNVLLSDNVSGGTGSYRYDWTGLPTGCANANQSLLACTPTSPATYDIAVAVTDTNGFTATSAPLSLAVAAWPAVSSFRASPSTVVVGNATVLTANVSGGTLPLVYAYGTAPDGCSVADRPNITCVLASPGYYNVTITVTDATGATATATAMIVVTEPGGGIPGSGGKSGASGPLDLELALAGAVGAAVVVAGVLLWRRGRRPKDDLAKWV